MKKCLYDPESYSNISINLNTQSKINNTLNEINTTLEQFDFLIYYIYPKEYFTYRGKLQYEKNNFFMELECVNCENEYFYNLTIYRLDTIVYNKKYKLYEIVFTKDCILIRTLNDLYSNINVYIPLKLLYKPIINELKTNIYENMIN